MAAILLKGGARFKYNCIPNLKDIPEGFIDYVFNTDLTERDKPPTIPADIYNFLSAIKEIYPLCISDENTSNLHGFFTNLSIDEPHDSSIEKKVSSQIDQNDRF
jgi:hypothetical protein